MSSTPPLDTDTRFSYSRTWLAYGRTMQAWIRTAVSLITFGFAVYRLAPLVGRNPADNRVLVTHEFGYILVGIGFLALVVGSVEYSLSVRVLRQEYGPGPRSSPVWFASIIAVLGVFALVSMIIVP